MILRYITIHVSAFHSKGLWHLQMMHIWVPPGLKLLQFSFIYSRLRISSLHIVHSAHYCIDHRYNVQAISQLVMILCQTVRIFGAQLHIALHKRKGSLHWIKISYMFYLVELYLKNYSRRKVICIAVKFLSQGPWMLSGSVSICYLYSISKWNFSN